MRYLLTVLVGLLSVLIAVFPEVSLQGAKDALALCGSVILPSLFPFFVCANLLISLGAPKLLSRAFGKWMRPVFRVNGVGALPLVLGLFSGYPCGAATTCRLYDEGCLSKNEAERLLAFTNNSGPLFLISAVGIGVYGSRKIGFLLYICHALGALLTGLVFRFFGKAAPERAPKSGPESSPFAAIGESVQSMISLCGYVVFFAVLLAMFKKLGILAFLSGALVQIGMRAADADLLVSGLLEITSGLSSAQAAHLPFVSMVLSLGGFSVLMQTYSFVKRSGLSIKPYLIGKVLSGGFSALCTKCALRLFPIDVAAFHLFSSPEPSVYGIYFLAFLTAFFLFLVFFLFSEKTR